MCDTATISFSVIDAATTTSFNAMDDAKTTLASYGAYYAS